MRRNWEANALDIGDKDAEDDQGMAIDPKLAAAVAVTRFGLGARPGEIDAVARDPRGWLLGQIRPEGADQPPGAFPPSSAGLIALYEYQRRRRAMKAGTDAMDENAPKPSQAAGRREVFGRVDEEVLARAQLASQTPAGFRERWALFWGNHFTVSAAAKPPVRMTAGAFEREAIRPHVFGRFSDLLLASTRHPAMLIYLDQAQSIGPGSPAGLRREAGLNENLAREILELHTLGANAGYSQADVTEFARALTGWSVVNARETGRPPGTPMFRAAAHEPGARTVLGRAYPQAGEAQGVAILNALAADPRTARRLSRKIAAHFVADDPPASLVARLEQAWTSSDGRLDAVARALVEAPEAWAPQPLKMKTPYEFVVSSFRAAGQAPRMLGRIQPTLAALGHRPFEAPSPEGWPDDAASWAAPDALVKRLQFAQAFAAAAAPATAPPPELAAAVLGPRLTPPTAEAVRRAESREEAFTLLLMSPEFQRR